MEEFALAGGQTSTGEITSHDSLSESETANAAYGWPKPKGLPSIIRPKAYEGMSPHGTEWLMLPPSPSSSETSLHTSFGRDSSPNVRVHGVGEELDADINDEILEHDVRPPANLPQGEVAGRRSLSYNTQIGGFEGELPGTGGPLLRPGRPATSESGLLFEQMQFQSPTLAEKGAERLATPARGIAAERGHFGGFGLTRGGGATRGGVAGSLSGATETRDRLGANALMPRGEFRTDSLERSSETFPQAARGPHASLVPEAGLARRGDRMASEAVRGGFTSSGLPLATSTEASSGQAAQLRDCHVAHMASQRVGEGVVGGLMRGLGEGGTAGMSRHRASTASYREHVLQPHTALVTSPGDRALHTRTTDPSAGPSAPTTSYPTWSPKFGLPGASAEPQPASWQGVPGEDQALSRPADNVHVPARGPQDLSQVLGEALVRDTAMQTREAGVRLHETAAEAAVQVAPMLLEQDAHRQPAARGMRVVPGRGLEPGNGGAKAAFLDRSLGLLAEGAAGETASEEPKEAVMVWAGEPGDRLGSGIAASGSPQGIAGDSAMRSASKRPKLSWSPEESLSDLTSSTSQGNRSLSSIDELGLSATPSTGTGDSILMHGPSRFGRSYFKAPSSRSLSGSVSGSLASTDGSAYLMRGSAIRSSMGDSATSGPPSSSGGSPQDQPFAGGIAASAPHSVPSSSERNLFEDPPPSGSSVAEARLHALPSSGDESPSLPGHLPRGGSIGDVVPPTAPSAGARGFQEDQPLYGVRSRALSQPSTAPSCSSDAASLAVAGSRVLETGSVPGFGDSTSSPLSRLLNSRSMGRGTHLDGKSTDVGAASFGRGQVESLPRIDEAGSLSLARSPHAPPSAFVGSQPPLISSPASLVGVAEHDDPAQSLAAAHEAVRLLQRPPSSTVGGRVSSSHGAPHPELLSSGARQAVLATHPEIERYEPLEPRRSACAEAWDSDSGGTHWPQRRGSQLGDDPNERGDQEEGSPVDARPRNVTSYRFMFVMEYCDAGEFSNLLFLFLLFYVT